MRYLLLYLLFFSFYPASSYALMSDDVWIGTKSQAQGWLSELKGDNICLSFPALDTGKDDYAVCWSFNNNAPVVQKADPKCEFVFTQDPEICAICTSGYMIDDDNVCVPEKCMESCTSCYSPYMCKENKCISGYYQKDWECRKCDESCAACSGSASYCTSCNTGYYPQNGECLSCPDGCKSCTATRCNSCATGYYLSSGKCLACPAGCKSCTSAGCSSCLDGYILSNGKCESETNTAPTNTVDSCPAGLAKSADGCCCIK